jgi:MFS family permease
MVPQDPTVGSVDTAAPYVEWTPVIAGALAASALSFVLFTFGSPLGIALASSSLSWRDASVGLAFLSGLYIMLVTFASFGFGGYIAGRLRSRWAASADTDEVEFRDGVHGLLVWALAVALGALLASAAAATVAATSAPAASIPNTTAGEAMIAYELDRFFRSPQVPQSAAETSYSRAEVARIALRAAARRHRHDLPEDRAQLLRIISSRTGVTGPEAEARVTDFVQRSTRSVRRARRSAVVIGFMTAAGLLVGAAVAWFAAAGGGSHRDGTPLSVNWRFIRSDRITSPTRQ